MNQETNGVTLVNPHLTRQADIIPSTTLHTPVTIIGAGAIGSFLALSLAKMGMTDITVYDFDDVSIENMNNQFYRFKDIGKPKVIALRDLIEDFTGVQITTVNGRFEPRHVSKHRGILVTAADTMATRRMVHTALAGYHMLSHIIDPRMGAELFVQCTINPTSKKDMDMWDVLLFDDSNAAPVRCTAKSTIYTATLAAGHVVKTIKNILLNEPHPRHMTWAINKSEDCFESVQ